MSEIIRCAFGMLSASERRQAAWLLAGIVAAGLIETIGLTPVLPFLAVAADPELIRSSRALNLAYSSLGVTDDRIFLLLLGGCVLGTIIATNALSVFVAWRSLRFALRAGHHLSVRLLASHLRQPYEFYLEGNTSKFVVDVVGRVADLVNGVLQPVLQMAARAVLSVFILILVFVLNPVLSMTAAIVVCGGYLCAYLALRSRVKRYGAVATQANEGRVRTVTEAFGGIKDIKVLGCEDFFERRFHADSDLYATNQAKNGVAALTPRYVLEVVAIGSMVGALLYFILAGHSFTNALPVLTLYAVAAYKLMPAIQQIYHGAALITYTGPSVEILQEVVQRMERTPQAERGTTSQPAPVFERQIVFDNVTYRYPGRDVAAVRGLSFSIPRDTSLGLVGATGAGKSTALDLALGLLEPASGRILVDDTDLRADNIRAWRSRIGYVPQFIYLADDTIARNIAFGVEESRIDMDRVAEAARLAQLHDFVTQLPGGYATAVGERGVRLSGGQRQRVGIARALYRRPALLIFDEATSALDSVTEAALVEDFAALAGKTTMLIVAHRITTVKDCDRIVVLDGGSVVDHGTYAQLYERSARFRALAA